MHHTQEGILFARFAPSEYHDSETLYRAFTLFLCARNESDVVHGLFVSKDIVGWRIGGKFRRRRGSNHVMMVPEIS